MMAASPTSLRKDGRPCHRREPQDVSRNAERIARLERMRAEALQGGGPVRVERQHAWGKLTARERLDLLLDPGSFVELDAFVTHRATEFGLDRQHFLGDGVVTGHGTIDGRLVFVFSQDFTVFGGSLSEAYAEKICKIMDLAMKVGRAGHRPQRFRRGADPGGRRVARRLRGDLPAQRLASGVVPQISVILGPCAGGAVYSPAMTDFTVMVEGTSYMFVTGPNVVKAVTHEEVDSEALGGAAVHTGRSGVAHLAARDEAEAMDYVRRLLAHLPQNNLADPPLIAASRPADRMDPELDDVVPDEPSRAVRHARRPPPRRGRRRVLRAPAGLGGEHPHRLRAPRRTTRRDRRPAAGGAGRRARHRRVGQGGPVRADLRRLQRPARHVRRRARVPARRRRRSTAGSSSTARSCSTRTARRRSPR